MTKKKTSKEKRILVASLLIAAAITVGGTFAWFTSQDEVTNRLTASADYGVSITETFTPPEDWVPGQEINKDVGAVNTGSVSAFVKLTVSNAMTLTYAEDTDTAPATDTKDNYVILSTSNPDEKTAIQAGGYLAYTSADGVDVGISGTAYTPTNSGIYIFRRSIDVTQDADTKEITETFEYAGYYFDGTDYYKLSNIAKSGDTYTYKYAAKKTEVVTPTLAYDSTNNRISATYSRDNSTTDDDIVIYINLATDAATNWTYGGDNSIFYLNQILAPGATSPNLIDNVVLADTTKASAYLNFDYDLNISLDSIQAVYDADGNVDATESAKVPTNDTFGATATVTANSPADQSATVTWTVPTTT